MATTVNETEVFSVYDSKSKGYVYWSTLPDSNVLGGKARASTADRDDHGRFMPNDFAAQLEWTLDPEHGRVGGQARARTAIRGHKGRKNWFAPNKKEK